MDSFNDVLDAAKAYCREHTADATYQYYISGLKAVSFENSNCITLEVRNDFICKIVSDRYTGLLKDAFKAVLGFDVEVKFTVPQPEPEAAKEKRPMDEASLPSGRYDFTFENFIRGPSNQFAFAAAQAVAANPSGAYNPLFIYGLHLQITGAAVATLISNTTAMFYFLAFIWKIRGVSVLTLSPGMYTLGEHIPAEVISVGLPSFLISMMGTVSNTVLNHIIAGYSSVAVAGMGIAKKLNMLAFAVGQGITQGTLPLIGYNYTSGNKKRMLDAIRALFVFSLGVALAIAVLLYTQAAAVSRLFIDNSETVAYGCRFLRIICSASPMTAMTFFALTVFQATGKKRQPIILSMLRKGTVDVPFMILFNHVFGIRGVAWATPVAEVTSLMVAAAMVIPYIRKLAREPERKGPVSETKTCKLVGK